MTGRFTRTVVAFGAGLVIASVALASAPTEAAAWCVPQRGSYPADLQTGWNRTVPGYNNPVSIQAGVREYWPYVANGDAVSAWTMLDFSGGAPLTDYAEVGWWAADKNSNHYLACGSKCMFIEISYSSGVTTHISLPSLRQPTDATTYYLTGWLPASSTMVFYYNGNLLWQSYPIAWIPDTAITDAETNNYDDQMPGAVQSHQFMYNTQYYDGAWHDINWDGNARVTNSNSYYFGATEVPDVHHNIEVWDGGCPGT